MSDAQVAVGIRAVALASAFLVRKLRDPEFLATAAGEEEDAPVMVSGPPATEPAVDADRGGRFRSIVKRGGELARQGGGYARQGFERWAAARPGTPAWEAAGLDQRCDWWFANLGRATSVLAALPGLTGAAGDRIPVRDLVSAAGQGLLLVAIALEYGIEDTDDHVALIGEILFGRQLDAAGQVSAARDEADELAVGATRRDAGRRAQAAALVRIGRTLSQLEAELGKRPQGHPGQRLVGALPGVGVIGHYRGERRGLEVVSEQGRAWCAARRASRGAIEVPGLPSRSAVVSPRVIAAPLFEHRGIARRALDGVPGADGALVVGAAEAAWLSPGDAVLTEIVLAVTPTDLRIAGRSGMRPDPMVWTFLHPHLADDHVRRDRGVLDFVARIPDGRWLGIRLLDPESGEAIREARASAVAAR
ncbi:hypothetical protein [Actinomycetospora sp. NBRC 106378]|uniref:hypothetical protein n=1 Tax=Actinomycetospora sp. NBRC 106378 TaxID=3032208 RepID=UPI0024A0C6DC|nr:hypothetical protein [Actinomycetospora sp. NBRC 106378]GLZ51711.1 hypothetical protein Acsp07_13280 [Actinomycetospora sp. NBRC 106378]